MFFVTATEAQIKQMKNSQGFIAALDQSGGSTPKALRAYGINESSYASEDEMFDLVHQMRTRIITSPEFSSEKIIGAILFEQTMNSKIEGKYSADYLLEDKNILPFLKVDKGLADEVDGVQIMKPMPDLDALLDTANERHIFGTKMRSVIKEDNEKGIQAVVKQQFEVAKQIIAKGLIPIIEPEVDIHSKNKVDIETILHDEIEKELNQLKSDELVMLKLTIPTKVNLYKDFNDHPNVIRVVALSGGYSTDEANRKLKENDGLIASFSRALAQDLNASQTDEEFNKALGDAVDAIYNASL